ncbi:MAG TPA: SRPBCC family protein [Stellaceae bacterium]|nr:SRPBCC family protein [Stellaceae bacterium]
MAQANDTKTGRKPEPLVISRIFSAPRALVFTAWSTADHMRRWFCPEHFTVPHATVDFRVGGVCEICMRAPDGQEFRSKGHYIEIVPAERLVFATGLVGENDAPRFTALTTVTFEDAAGGTRMTVHQAYEIFDDSALGAIEGAPEGWRTTLDRLEQEVARIQSVETRSVVHAIFTLERTYDAAPAQVFHALTDKAAKARWFGGGDGYVVLERAMDVRPGGRERVKGRWASGTVSTFDAVYYDVVPNARIVYAYEMSLDDRKISVSLATLELNPVGEKTRLVVTEQGAFLDGYDDAGSREHGTGFLLDRLGASLKG